MKLFKTTKVFASGAVLALCASSAAYAGSDEGRFYINPAIGMQDLDGDRGLQREDFFSLGLEYRYGDHWATELSAMDSDPEVESNGNNVDLRQYGLDGIYYFRDRSEGNRFEPYANLGVGHAIFDGNNNEDNETQVRMGFGLRYLLTEAVSLKADTKLLYGTDDDTRDSLVSLGLSIAFGGPAKAPVVAAEPAVLDSDGDGVLDDRDQCPQTPAGVAVDVNGCALDGDADGVPDYRDDCPTTPAGREVDNKGCKYVLTRSEEIALRVNFASNSSVVPQQYIAEVENVANFMKRYATVTAVIEGHTDNTGKDSYNQALSQRRADAVKMVLIERFNIDADRLSSVGYGEASPIDTNDTAAGRLANRRVVAVMKAEIKE